MKYLPLVALVVLMSSCKNDTKKPDTKQLTANEIINKAIDVAGGKHFANSDIGFDFRDKAYAAKREAGKYLLLRVTVEENNDSIFDILSNDGFERFINDEVIKLEDSIANKYAASVNSVHYFSVLPYGLNDASVNKKFLGEERIKSKDFYKIKVTFNEDGGGEDFEDVFIYWVDKSNFKVQYLAYSYNETDGKGMRFREAYNERYKNGLRFVDYNNYKRKDDTLKLIDLAKAFENNKLELLSKIELKDVTVTLLN